MEKLFTKHHTIKKCINEKLFFSKIGAFCNFKNFATLGTSSLGNLSVRNFVYRNFVIRICVIMNFVPVPPRQSQRGIIRAQVNASSLFLALELALMAG
jgi:hypothetical protein